MLFIAGSESTIGSDSPLFPSENPSHRVRIRSFWIDKLEVGNQEYCEFLNKKGSYADSLGRIYIAINNPDCQITYSRRVFTVKSGYEKLPVTMVTWYGAEAYAKWAGKRLPYEAEWEYACKGGMLVSNTLLSNTEQYAWSRANTLSKSPMPRGTKKPNLLNLYDMLGNVWEWCADWYSDEYYQGRFLTMYQGPQEGTKKVCRGGASNSLEMFLHPSVRQGEDPNKQSLFIGFRCARDQ
jgi:formylglycine-generating enzyme required for sulfatase activity